MNKTIKSCDVGSLPFEGNFSRFLRDRVYFERQIVKSFVDKLNTGLDVPIYPQFRDMSIMFIEMMDGAEKFNDFYSIAKPLTLNRKLIQEVYVLRKHAKLLAENMEKPIQAGICVTGPYTLSHLFRDKNLQTIELLGEKIKEIVRNNLISSKNFEITLFALDEPSFGFAYDYKTSKYDGIREIIRKVWEDIFYEAKSKGVDTLIHLHTTKDKLFFEVDSVDIVGSEVNDELYFSQQTKKLLEEYDKFLNVSICRTNFREIVIEKAKMFRNKYENYDEVLKVIGNKEINPAIFLEETDIMVKRLKRVSKLVGVERIKYASPECGLRGFPTYECALTYLKRVVKAVKTFEKSEF
jgi:5-methyltetrahydropteroyltriglutamate--homocysteine methyltransferase